MSENSRRIIQFDKRWAIPRLPDPEFGYVPVLVQSNILFINSGYTNQARFRPLYIQTNNKRNAHQTELIDSSRIHHSNCLKCNEEKTQKNLKSSPKRPLFCVFLCLIGMLLQSFQMTLVYFNYEVISTTLMEFESKFIMPAASICYGVNHIRIPTMFPEGHPCRGPLTENNYSRMGVHDHRKKECERILLFNHSYTEVFNNLTWNLKNMFISYTKFIRRIHWWDEIKATDPGNNPERFSSFYKPPKKCIKVSWDENMKFNTLNSTYSHAIMHIEAFRDDPIHNDRIPWKRHGPISMAAPLDFYLHDPRSYPKGHDTPCYIMDYNGQLLLTYHVYQIEYLPAPFRFNCLDYQTIEGSRREDCIEGCMRNMNPKELSIQYTFVEIPVNDSRILVNNPDKYNKEYDKCSRRCPLSCYTDLYDSSENLVARPWSHPLFMIGHDQMSFKTKFKQKLPLVEFILYIASILGLWIGFSVYDSIFIVLKWAKRQIQGVNTYGKFCWKFTNGLLFLVCSVFFVLHTIDLTNHYMEYETNTMITISNEKQAPIPTISLCEPLQWLYRHRNQTLGWQEMQLWDRALYDEPIYDLLTRTKNLSIELGFNLGQKVIHQFSSPFWINETEFIQKNIQYYIHKLKKCVHFKHPDGLFYDGKANSYEWIQFRGIRFDTRHRGNAIMFIYFHPDKQLARGMVLPAVYFIQENRKSEMFLADSYETYYLPAPFSHRCVNYHKIGLESNGHCFEKCVDSDWISNNPKYAAIQMSFSLKDLEEPRNQFRKAFKAVPNLELNTYCQGKCPVDCITRQYKTIRKQPFRTGPPHTSEIIVGYTGINTNILYSGSLPFYQYLLLLSGVAGLWFNISINSIASTLIASIKLILQFGNNNGGSMIDQTKRKGIFKYLKISILTILMVAHVVYVTYEYLSFGTQSEVTAEYVGNFKPPDESFCWEMTQILNRKMLPPDSSCQMNNEPEKFSCDEELINNYSLEYLMNNLTRDPISLVKELKQFNSHKDEIKNIPVEEIRKHFILFYKHPFKCMKTVYDPIKREEYSLDSQKLLRHRLGVYYSFMIDSQALYGFFRIDSLTTYTTTQNHYPWSHRRIEDKHFFGASYIQFTGSVITESESLPEPVTICKKYSKLPFKSRAECIEVCIARKQENLAKKFPQLIYHPPFKAIYLAKNLTAFEEFLKQCESKCPKGCFKAYFEWKHSGNDIDPRHMTGYEKRHVYITTRISFSLKLPLIDFIIYVGGILGLWFGLSLYHAASRTTIFFKSKCNI